MEPEQIKVAKVPWYKFKATKFDSKLLAFWQFLAATIIIYVAIAGVVVSFYPDSDPSSFDENSSAVTEEITSTATCNVQGMILRGDVVTYISPADYNDNGDVIVDEQSSENIVGRIEDAEKDDDIKAIVLEIDSYGGAGVAGEEIANALKSAKKPTVALIRNGAASAAYWAATGASRIFASKNSDVGSIGVTMSYLDAVEQNKKEGYTYNSLSSGKFKDTGDPDKQLTPEEIKLIMRDVNIMHQNFIKDVSDNRKLSIEKVTSLADGSTMLGEAALKNGLIDQIGGQTGVNQYLKDKIGEDVEICW